MQPQHFQFGGGASQTTLHPLVALGMSVAIILILLLPRKKAVVPFLLTFFTIPVEQVLVFGGVHLTVLRILILTVLIRMVSFRGSSSQRRFVGGFNALDKVVVLWSISALIIFSLQWMEVQAFIKCLGDLVESLGGYMAARFLIFDRDTVRRTIKILAVIFVIQGACMTREQFTHQNIYSFLGALPPDIRDGHVRSQGVIGSLYGGVFAAVSIPLFIWLWSEGKSRLAAYAGFAGATAMVITSHASTSVGTYLASLVALGFWPLRKQMRVVRWVIVAILVGLHVVMHGPVWSLLEHIDLTGGSSSYHRYLLLDNCIRHFGEWWLLGYKHYGEWGFVMWDVCNQFVLDAVRGGLLTLILNIAIFSRSFSSVGVARRHVDGDHRQEWFLWCLGSSLFANLVASFGINYMVQLLMGLFPLLAFISVARFEASKATNRRVYAPASMQSESVPQTVTLALPPNDSTERMWPGLFEA